MSQAKQLHQEGRFRGRVLKSGIVKDPESQKPSFVIEIELTTRQIFSWYGSLSTEVRPPAEYSAWDVTARTLKSCGWDGKDIKNAQIAPELFAVVGWEEWDGITRAKIVSLGMSAVERDAMKGDELDHLAEMLNNTKPKERQRRRTSANAGRDAGGYEGGFDDDFGSR